MSINTLRKGDDDDDDDDGNNNNNNNNNNRVAVFRDQYCHPHRLPTFE